MFNYRKFENLLEISEAPGLALVVVAVKKLPGLNFPVVVVALVLDSTHELRATMLQTVTI